MLLIILYGIYSIKYYYFIISNENNFFMNEPAPATPYYLMQWSKLECLLYEAKCNAYSGWHYQTPYYYQALRHKQSFHAHESISLLYAKKKIALLQPRPFLNPNCRSSDIDRCHRRQIKLPQIVFAYCLADRKVHLLFTSCSANRTVHTSMFTSCFRSWNHSYISVYIFCR